MNIAKRIQVVRKDNAEHSPPWVACTACTVPLDFTDGLPWAYFEGDDTTCSECASVLDWPKAIERRLAERHDIHRFAAVGAATTSFDIELEPGRSAEIDVGRFGVPEDAQILGKGYAPITDWITPGWPAAWPLEDHGNTPERWEHPRVFRLFGKPFTATSTGPTTVQIEVTWVRRGDLVHGQLVDACHMLRVVDPARSVLAANTAAEIAFGRLVRKFLEGLGVEARHAQRFSRRGYWEQLHVILPALVAALGIPWLDESILHRLETLRGQRNTAAHSSTLSAATDELPALLAAAVIGASYTHFAEERFDRHASRAQPRA